LVQFERIPVILDCTTNRLLPNNPIIRRIEKMKHGFKILSNDDLVLAESKNIDVILPIWKGLIEVHLNFGSVNVIDSNHYQVNWNIPPYATEVISIISD